MNRTSYEIAKRCIGIAEIPGGKSHPMILWAFSLAGLPGAGDDTAWCGAFATLIAFLGGEPIPLKPARARSWLTVGESKTLDEAQEGDTVILKRGEGAQPGPEVLDAQGHVGRLVSVSPGGMIEVLGGNQANKVSVQTFPASRLLGIRRS